LITYATAIEGGRAVGVKRKGQGSGFQGLVTGTRDCPVTTGYRDARLRRQTHVAGAGDSSGSPGTSGFGCAESVTNVSQADSPFLCQAFVV